MTALNRQIYKWLGRRGDDQMNTVCSDEVLDLHCVSGEATSVIG